jgi:hypothetical protein
LILRFFADILPLASTEEPQSIWRFEMAFVLTAVQWSGRIEARTGLRMMPTVGIEIGRAPL